MKFSAMDFIKHYSNLPIGPNLHVVKNHYRFMQEVKQIQMSETVRGVRTHVRSGHWRHQWRGSRKEGCHYVVPIWINPTLVRGSDAVGFTEETTI